MSKANEVLAALNEDKGADKVNEDRDVRKANYKDQGLKDKEADAMVEVGLAFDRLAAEVGQRGSSDASGGRAAFDIEKAIGGLARAGLDKKVVNSFNGELTNFLGKYGEAMDAMRKLEYSIAYMDLPHKKKKKKK
jgi:hypothetical protein